MTVNKQPATSKAATVTAIPVANAPEAAATAPMAAMAAPPVTTIKATAATTNTALPKVSQKLDSSSAQAAVAAAGE
ncbi:hypothetical protein [Zobellia uliginosa]|uniref:hypothetical protein n=1 Tax=Zobellia uliginosa TaxID=143224 RepID=UPI001589C877|nr:hypothetical protein [Zobellia uliginosa]